MFRPTINITIGDRPFNYVTDMSILSSWKNFSDIGRIVIPNKMILKGEFLTIGNNNVFSRGDFIIIETGYYPKKKRVFEGYVSRIKPELPCTIEFQDVSWLLKQTNVTFGLKTCTIVELMDEALRVAKEKATGNIAQALEDIEVQAVDAQLGSFRATNVNLVQILETLKKTYSLISYFRGNILFIGLAYTGSDSRFKFTFQENIFNDNLEYQREEDVKIKVKAISMLPDNTKIEVEVGDADGETRTLFKYNLNETDLREIAEREVSRFRYEGWRGTFTTFMTDYIQHGDEIEIIDKRLPEKNGVYFAETVEIVGGIGGYFNKISLGAKVG